jgi:transposase
MSISELTHMPEPVRRIEVFTGAGRRRNWSAAEKVSIIAESYDAGTTVCGVARRHGLTPQQLFAWRRQARRRESANLFVPAVIEAAALPDPTLVTPTPHRTRRRKTPDIELEIAGVEVRIGSAASPRAIAAVIRALKQST